MKLSLETLLYFIYILRTGVIFFFYYVDLGNENPIAEDVKRRDQNLATAFPLKETFMKALYESRH